MGSSVLLCSVSECYLKCGQVILNAYAKSILWPQIFSWHLHYNYELLRVPLILLLDQFCSLNTRRSTQIALHFKSGTKKIQ